MARMHIAFVEPHLGVYGGIRRILEFANRFVDRGVDVTIHHPAGTPCDWMPCRADVRGLDSLTSLNPDVLIFNNPPDFAIARRTRARLKVHYILELYDRERLTRFDPRILWPRKGRMLSLKRALHLPFLQVANASWIQRWLRERMGMDVELQLGGVNRDLFHPVPGVRPEGPPWVILCSGDAREHKGTATVRAAVECLRASGWPLELREYHGQRIEQGAMAGVYASAHVFVDAQWHAGWNNPVVEAMACGTPVVCSNIGGIEDFAFNERTALLAPVRDEAAFAAAIERMLSTPALRSDLAAAALREVERFNWDDAADQFLALLSGHLERAGKGRT